MLAFIAHTCHAAAAAPPAGTGPVAHNSADEDDAEDEAGGRDDEDEGGAKEGGLLDDEHDGEGGEVGDELDKVREPAEAEEEAPARAPTNTKRKADSTVQDAAKWRKQGSACVLQCSVFFHHACSLIRVVCVLVMPFAGAGNPPAAAKPAAAAAARPAAARSKPAGGRTQR